MNKINLPSKREVSITGGLKGKKVGETVIINFHASGRAQSANNVTCTIEDPKKNLVKNPIGKILHIFEENGKTFAELSA